MSRLASLLTLALFAAISFGCDSGSTTPAESSTAKNSVSPTVTPGKSGGKTAKVAKRSMTDKAIPSPPKTRGDL